MSNIVAIIGRTNVGKSTLYNRLTESKQAIVADISGVTRDRHYGIAEWTHYVFTVIDTGGYIANSDDIFEKATYEQVLIAIEEATAILFMVDVQTGVTDLDDVIAKMLRKSVKPVYVVVNKVDNHALYAEANSFYSLGFGSIYPISSMTGSGTGELLDALVTNFSDMPDEPNTLPKYAITGRPNVGKSSLCNMLIGQNRSIVTPKPGTTRDPIHVHYKKFGHEFLLIDTAGLRKKTKVSENIEFYSVIRAIKALDEADVVLLMIDALQGMQAQDINIFHLAHKKRKGIVILVNKWDLIHKNHKTSKEFEQNIYERVAPFTDVPIIFTSVLEKQRTFKVIDIAQQVYDNRRKKIPTPQLNRVLLPIIEKYPPPAVKGKYVKIKYITQLNGPAPIFIFFCNLPQYVKEPYRRFIENKIRGNFNFLGVPIQIYFRR